MSVLKSGKVLQASLKKEGGGFLHPGTVLKTLRLRRGAHVADFGSGAGYFTIPIAEAVGAEGVVYAIDIKEEPLAVLRSHIKLFGLFMIRPIRADLERPQGSTLEANTLDFVFSANVLHQVKDKGAVISEAARVLKNKAKLVIVEWNKSAPFGPSKNILLARDDIIDLAQKHSFKLKEEFAAGEFHFGLIFEK